ncbi:MAG: TolC family protein [Saprospiraceae bacterium]|nr:TolC family protein [Saprospiraceae bacterium]
MKNFLCFGALMLVFTPLFAQRVLPLNEAVELALKAHPSQKAAALNVEARQYAEKSAFNLPNPELNAESPTGTFYAVGILQEFEFPTVYNRQKKVAMAETDMARVAQSLNANELRYAVRSLYLNAQIARYEAMMWGRRDSFYQAIAQSAERQFTAGEIDAVQRSLTQNEAGMVHMERQVAQSRAAAFKTELSRLLLTTENFEITSLEADTSVNMVPENRPDNPATLLELASAGVAARQADLAKSKAMPNFSVGYLNQGEQETPIDYRFRATMSIPLWVGQYTAGVRTARTEEQAAFARAESERLSADMELRTLQTERNNALETVMFLKNEALPRSRNLERDARRLQEAGQMNYPDFLRTLDQTFSVEETYVMQVQRLNAAQLRLAYLLGQ